MNTHVQFRVMPLHMWRLIPWYSSGRCREGCCFNRTFTWVFLLIRVIRTKEDV